MSRSVRSVVLVCALAALCLASAAPADAAVRLGPDTSAPPGVNTGCGASDCTFVNRTSPTFTLAAPFSGVLVRWRIRTDGATANWRLRTVQEPSASMFIATGSTDYESVVPGAERTFLARLPIAAGDRLGVDGPPSATAPLTTSSGGTNARFNPPLVVGAAPQSPAGAGAGFVGMYNADLEADRDGDGFGDETQDFCPAAPGTQIPCAPCRGRPVTLAGTVRRDILRGTSGPDVIAGYAGRDTISGLGGDDVICGGASRDVLRGNGGRDTLFGDAGRDKLVGGPGRDRLRGGAGRDVQRP